MKVLQRMLNIGVSGDLSSLEKLARQIFNLDLFMGVLLPTMTVLYYLYYDIDTPLFLRANAPK